MCTRMQLASEQFQATEIDADMVFKSLKTAGSAGAMDGWHPKKLAMLSRKTCGYIATMLKQIEGGAHGQDPLPM